MTDRSHHRGLWFLIAVLVSAVLAAPAWAQVELGPLNPTMASQLRFSQLRIVGGRLQAVTDDPGPGIDYNSQGGNHQERLQLNSSNGLVTLAYRVSRPEFNYVFEIRDGSEVRIRSEIATASKTPPWELTQHGSDPWVLRFNVPDATREVKAPSFWHLMLAEPEFCRRELVPLMEVLRPKWGLLDDSRELVAALLESSGNVVAIDRQRARKLIAQLGSQKFTERQAADRQLRSMGASLLPLLRGVPQEQLDPEQRFRLAAIESEFAGLDREDTPQSVALWMSGDPTTWLWLLRHADPDTRRAARDQLQRLLGSPVEFTPDADQATRDRQFPKIAEQVEQFWK